MKTGYRLLIFLLFLTGLVSKVNAEEVLNIETDRLKLESRVIEQATDAINNSDSLVLHGAIDLFSPTGIKFDEGIVKSVKVGLAYDGPLVMQQLPGQDFASNYTVTGVEPFLIMKFRDNKTEFRTIYNFVRNFPNTQNPFTEKISEISISREITPNQHILLGQAKRLPIGIEGQPLPQYQDTVARAQIARTFSNTRAFGIRNIGKYKYADYDIGVYDSTRYMQDFFNGQEFVGWVNIAPLANLDEKKYGKLTMGTGCQVGSAKYDFNVFGAYVGYKYKKFATNLEYANADGYNGNLNSPNKANGFYTTAIYNLHPKFQLVGRYDIFDPNKRISNNSIAEYTAGINYIPHKYLKFLVNYVRQNKENGPDSNLIMFATRVMF